MSTTTNTNVIFHEMYGHVTRSQLATYRRYNVSPSDHDGLVDTFGEDDHAGIVRAVKLHSSNGMYSEWARHDHDRDSLFGSYSI